jgi:hypothetical protein
VALGDWHGTKQVHPKAWYSGTHEADRFSRGEEYQTGNVLLVEVNRAQNSSVQMERTGKMNWHTLLFHFHCDDDINRLEEQLQELTGGRVNNDLMKLSLSGSLGLEAHRKLDRLLESQEARLIRLDVEREVRVSPTAAELQKLSENTSDPLVAAVAKTLLDQTNRDGEDGEIAREALKQLFLSI